MPEPTPPTACTCTHSIDRHGWSGCASSPGRLPSPGVCPCTRRPSDILADALAVAWGEGFKQGGPMHDVDYDDPDAQPLPGRRHDMSDDLTERLAALNVPASPTCDHSAHVAAVLTAAGAGFVADVERVTPEQIADQRAKGWPDFHPEDYCHRCGERNLVWFTDSEAWNVATAAWSAETGRDGICCPRCFAEMHEAATGEPTTWHLTPDDADLRSRVEALAADASRAYHQRPTFNVDYERGYLDVIRRLRALLDTEADQ